MLRFLGRVLVSAGSVLIFWQVVPLAPSSTWFSLLLLLATWFAFLWAGAIRDGIGRAYQNRRAARVLAATGADRLGAGGARDGLPAGSGLIGGRRVVVRPRPGAAGVRRGAGDAGPVRSSGPVLGPVAAVAVPGVSGGPGAVLPEGAGWESEG